MSEVGEREIAMKLFRWRAGGLFGRVFVSFFAATLVTALVAMYVGRFDGPFGFLRDSVLVAWFNHNGDNNLNSGVLFVFLATAVGTLTGVLVSATLTRRLRRVAVAADAWSRGDLTAQVRDRSRDELGQLARDLDRMAGQLRTLLDTRRALAVVEERNRLARELHDTVKQHVFAVALLVRAGRLTLAREGGVAVGSAGEASSEVGAAADDLGARGTAMPHPSATARAADASGDAEALSAAVPVGTLDAAVLDSALRRFADAEDLATTAGRELDALIRALRPAAIADRGLAAVLREETAAWSARTGIAADVRVTGERETPLEVEEALLRVAQEALANVARHSGATQAQVRLVWEGDRVRLAVRDDGKGFDPTFAATGVGLASMRERMQALGGGCAVTSHPGGGTLVEAWAPTGSVSPARVAVPPAAPLPAAGRAGSPLGAWGRGPRGKGPLGAGGRGPNAPGGEDTNESEARRG